MVSMMKFNKLGLFVVLLINLCVHVFVDAKAAEPLALIDAKLEASGLELSTTRGKISIRALDEQSVEVFYQPAGIKQLPSFALPEDLAPASVALTLADGEDALRLTLPNLALVIEKSPLRLRFEKDGRVLAQEESGLFIHETMRGFRFALDDNEQILGGGQRVLGMNRRGHRMPLYNKAHYGYSLESNQMYYSLPAVMSVKPREAQSPSTPALNDYYIIAFDNSASGHLDIGHTEADVLQFEAVAGRTAYIFSASDSAQSLVQNFVSLTGKQPLPPRWALGNYASRFGYRSQEETLNTVDKFIEQDFPLDAVVLDLFWFGPDIKGHMGNLNWDKNAFPEPEKMIAQLKDKGVNTILITEPFILSSASQWDSAVEHSALAKNLALAPRRFDFYFGNTGLVDVFDPKAQDWFWQYYSKLNEQGVAGWWGDLGEPEVHPGDALHLLDGEYVTADEIHNVYGHQWAQMVYERQLDARPHQRPFVMMRSGFLGTQRYGMIPWTGDVERSWNGLKPQVELALQMSLFGLAYIHSDLGGFAGGESFDAELYVRWMQYGAFQSVYRPHAQDHIPPEPVFHDKQTQDLVRPFVKLRYQMLPYNYSLSMRNSLYGEPLMRPLFYHFPEANIARSDAYMWGESMLVSPVVEPGKTSQSIVLPEGVWFNFFGDANGARALSYKGGQSVDIPTPINEIPVLVKAGAFIPMVDSMQSTQDYSSERLHIRHYVHKSAHESHYTMYEDDGKSPHSISEEAYQSLHFKSVFDESLVISASAKGSYEGAPSKRHMMFELIGLEQAPQSLLSKGAALLRLENRAGLDTQNGYYWDDASNTLFVSSSLVSSAETSDGKGAGDIEFRLLFPKT